MSRRACFLIWRCRLWLCPCGQEGTQLLSGASSVLTTWLLPKGPLSTVTIAIVLWKPAFQAVSQIPEGISDREKGLLWLTVQQGSDRSWAFPCWALMKQNSMEGARRNCSCYKERRKGGEIKGKGEKWEEKESTCIMYRY